MEHFKNLIRIPVITNTKIPAVSGWTDHSYSNTNVDTNQYDTGIITGIKSNLLVLDVDIKDNGIEEINTFIAMYGTIDTFTVKTPTGGLHYYFKYKSTNNDTNYLIEEYITNRTKYRGCGLDIRTNGGYIKAPPSPNYKIINNTSINEINETLLLWLLEDSEQYEHDVKQTKTTNSKIFQKSTTTYNIDEIKLKNILNTLHASYNDSYSKWLLILTVCKNISLNTFDTYKIFDEYSQQNKIKYNKENNLNIWNKNLGQIDVNYLVKRINRETETNIPLIEKFKPSSYNINMNTFDKLTINKLHLEYDQEIFNNYDTIAIDSTTGTGKTTSTAKYSKQYINTNPHIKFLSLVNLVKLNEQQLETFNDQGLNVLNYQEVNSADMKNNNIICCLNSIHNKLNWLNEEELSYYIVYIDEVSSFIDSLLFNDKLNHCLKQTYLMLMKIIKNCHKLILSDAIITPNVMNLIEKRTKPKRMYILNTYQKYKGIEAIRQNNENDFLNNIIKHIETDKYFLFGADSKTSITKYYNEMIKQFPTKQDKFLLITADTMKKLNNVEKQFKNKFVFFSPSITTGINFNIKDKQDVFIYIKRKTINPASSFQQATRTRNINKLYYYSSCKENNPRYNTADDVKLNYKMKLEQNEKLLNLSSSINEDDDITIINNTFFSLFCDGIYQQDTEQTNKVLHFESILRKQGFKITYQGDKTELNRQISKTMKTELDEQLTEQFHNFVSDMYNEVNVWEIPQYKKYLDKMEYLHIEEHELYDFEFLLTNEYNYNSFFSFMKMFWKTECLKEKITDSNNMNVKKLDEVATKLLLLRKFETTNGITPFDINFTSKDIKINIKEDEYNYLQTVFRMGKTKPTHKYELQKVYIGMLRNIFGNLNIIISKKTKTKERKDITIYSFNIELIEKLFKLIFNSNSKELDDNLVNKLNVKRPNTPTEVIEDFYNSYLFGK